MCLKRLAEKDEKKELRKLEEEFPCWKIVRKSGHCEYDMDHNQPRIERKGTYVAQSFPKRRMRLDYPPSFHAFLERPTLSDNNQFRGFRIIKCWAGKKDINRIGCPQADYSTILAVAVSRIMMK